jgi:hypothetical protein
MPLWVTPAWRRSVLALVFAGAGGVLTTFAFWLAWNVLEAPWPPSLAGQRLTIVGISLYIVLGLLGLVLTGLAMTVALRQVSGKFMGSEFSASGSSDDTAQPATVTTTTATVVTPGSSGDGT